MAKYWKNLQKHKDKVEKHIITKEEVEFLKSIQKEMNTQDHVGQADPRYWVIRDYEKVYGKDLNNADGICIYDSCNCNTVFETEYDLMDIEKTIEEIIKELKEQEYEVSEDAIEKIRDSYGLDDLADVLRGIEEYDFTVNEYQKVPKDDGMFLTHKAAIRHLKNNEHHYSKDAHTYAKTAWRSQEDKLWEILQTVDFDTLETLLKDYYNMKDIITPKKPIDQKYAYNYHTGELKIGRCPNCNEPVSDKFDFCLECKKSLDWSEEAKQ